MDALIEIETVFLSDIKADEWLKGKHLLAEADSLEKRRLSQSLTRLSKKSQAKLKGKLFILKLISGKQDHSDTRLNHHMIHLMHCSFFPLPRFDFHYRSISAS